MTSDANDDNKHDKVGSHSGHGHGNSSRIGDNNTTGRILNLVITSHSSVGTHQSCAGVWVSALTATVYIYTYKIISLYLYIYIYICEIDTEQTKRRTDTDLWISIAKRGRDSDTRRDS